MSSTGQSCSHILKAVVTVIVATFLPEILYKSKNRSQVFKRGYEIRGRISYLHYINTHMYILLKMAHSELIFY